MDIEKIKNYNQKIFAALGTIILIAAVIGLISLIVLIYTTTFMSRAEKTNTLLTEEKVEKLKKDSLRQQIISYDTPQLLDTLDLIYLITVKVKTLDKPEELNREVLGIVGKGIEVAGGRNSLIRNFYGTFNNCIFYDYKNNTSFKLSDSRFVGDFLTTNKFEDEIIIVFEGADKDTDKDKIITMLDYNSLFIYSLKTRELKKLNIENSTVLNFHFIRKTKDIFITFGYDRNKNSRFDDEFEPTFIMKYDYNNDNLIPLVDKELGKDLQNIIDNN